MFKDKILSMVSILGLLGGNAQAAGTTNISSTPYHLSGGTAASPNSTLVGTGQRYFDWLYASNPTATGVYLKLYNTAVAPTCSSAVGLTHVFPIPPNWGGFIIQPTLNEAYSKGLGFCVTASGTDTDASSGVAGIFIEGGYR